jgi:hypothetical protein
MYNTRTIGVLRTGEHRYKYQYCTVHGVRNNTRTVVHVGWAGAVSSRSVSCDFFEAATFGGPCTVSAVHQCHKSHTGQSDRAMSRPHWQCMAVACHARIEAHCKHISSVKESRCNLVLVCMLLQSDDVSSYCEAGCTSARGCDARQPPPLVGWLVGKNLFGKNLFRCLPHWNAKDVRRDTGGGCSGAQHKIVGSIANNSFSNRSCIRGVSERPREYLSHRLRLIAGWQSVVGNRTTPSSSDDIMIFVVT